MILTPDDLQNEIWMDINEYEGMYQISNLGRVKSLARKVKRYGKCGGYYNVVETMLNPYKHKKGYLYVSLTKNGKGETFTLHRLVGKYFIPNPENKPEVNHLRNELGVIDKTDNRAIVLEWATAKENINHAWENGMMNQVKYAASINGKNGKIGLNTQTGIFYISAKEAADTVGIMGHNLSDMLTGKYRNRTDFIYV